MPATGIDPAIADLGTGQATLTFSAGSGLLFNRTSAIAPFSANIALSINVIDTDAAAAPNPVTFGSGTGISFSTGATQYYGRLALRDAVGSELLDLPMPLTTQYYLSTTQGFTTNTADSCTTAPALAFSNYQLNLSSGETCVRDTGHPGSSGQGCSAAAAPSLQYHPVAVAGNFNLVLSAPGAGDAGAVTGHRHRTHLAAVQLGQPREPARHGDLRRLSRPDFPRASARGVLAPGTLSGACLAPVPAACFSRQLAAIYVARSSDQKGEPSCESFTG